VVERFFSTLKYEYLYRAIIGDGNALAVELGLFRRTYNTLRPHQALDDLAAASVRHRHGDPVNDRSDRPVGGLPYRHGL
jgi:transposase InsO family protein